MRNLQNASLALIFLVVFAFGFAAVRQSQEQPTQAQSTEKTDDPNIKHEQRESFWKRTTDDPTAFFTAVLGLIATSQAVLYWQLLYMRRGMDDAKTAAEAASLAAATSRKALVATFRPKLVVRRISLSDAFPGRPLKVEWIVANIGGTPGTITESNATIRISGPRILEPIPEWSNETDSMGNVRVLPGAGLTFIKFSDQDLVEWEDDAQSVLQAFTYFMGYIQYRDEIGILRFMAFCRRYNRQTRRFDIVDDPNYEYGD